MSIRDAAVSGASARLRPILMTSFAMIIGLIPLMMATGVGQTGTVRWERGHRRHVDRDDLPDFYCAGVVRCL